MVTLHQKSLLRWWSFKNHHRLDSQICCLDKLCDVLDLSSLTLNLSDLWLCTRLPMVRSVAAGRLRSSFTLAQTENVKYGGDGSFWSKKVSCTQKSPPWLSVVNASSKEFESTYRFESVLGNTRYPTRGNVRATLPLIPTAEEVGGEDEFQAAAFSSALAPSSAKKYSAAFVEFLERTERQASYSTLVE